ncbi:MAG: 6-phosphogluconolactonase [Gaiellaceae bacterium]
MIEVSADPARRVAELLAEAARAGGQIALTGGSAPRPAYELAAELEPDWSEAHVWWGDERCVPPDDERSNYRLAEESLLSRLAERPVEHRILGELAPAVAADTYDAELEGVRLDLVLLGMGPDGHVASLFPGSPGLEERLRRAIAATPALEPFVERVSMTLPVLTGAAHVVFMVVGAAKAETVARAFEDEPSAETPASLVRGLRTTVVLDVAAASRLRSSP